MNQFLAKDDLCSLNKPEIRGLKNAWVLEQMAVLRLKRISRFIVKVMLSMRKMLADSKVSKLRGAESLPS
jgi:hypothetical protein